MKLWTDKALSTSVAEQLRTETEYPEYVVDKALADFAAPLRERINEARFEVVSHQLLEQALSQIKTAGERVAGVLREKP